MDAEIRRKRYAIELKNAEELDRRERKRQRTWQEVPRPLSGGNLLRAPQIVNMYEHGMDPFPQRWNPEAEVLYINAQVSGQSLLSSSTLLAAGGDPEKTFQLCVFDRNYDKIILQRPCDYHMAIVRVQFPLSAVPLFYYPLQSCVISVGVITKIDGVVGTDGVLAHWQFIQDQVTPLTIDPASDIPSDGSNVNYPHGAIAIWNVQQMLDAIMRSARLCVGELSTASNLPAPGTFTFLPSATLPPLITFDEPEQIFTVQYEGQSWYGGPDYVHYSETALNGRRQWPLLYPLGTAFFFFNSNLQQRFFPMLPVEFVNSWQFSSDFVEGAGVPQTGLPVGADAVVRLNDLYETVAMPANGAQLPLVAPLAVDVSAQAYPYSGANSYMRVGFEVGVGYWVIWYNPQAPHGVRPGDTVVVSGVRTVPWFNRVYTIHDVGTVDNGDATVGPPPTAVPLSNTATPPSLATAWRALVVTTVAPPGPALHNYGTTTTDSNTVMVSVLGTSLPGSLESVNSQVPDMVGWNNGCSFVRVGTYNIPVRDEIAPAVPKGDGIVPPTDMVTRRVLIDIASDPAGEEGKMVQKTANIYDSRENYRWFELLSESPLTRWSVYADWVDQFGNEYPMYLSPGEFFEVKAILKRKDVKLY
jgi:hypothetical protein